jgi:site-specific DNA recombinase
MTDCPFPPGSKIFAYLRDSGHDRQELSIAQQENQVRQFALEHQLTLTHIYQDEAKKGGGAYTDKRLALHQMMHDIRRGCAEVGLIVWKFSRFARSQDHAQLYRAEIRSHGKIFFSLRDKIPDGPFGRLFEAFIDYKDEQFIQDMSIDIQRALRDLVTIYGCVPGTPPVGFMRQPVTISHHRDGTARIAAKWVPDPAKIPTIQQAFAMRASGQSLNAIIDATHGELYVSKNSYRTFFCNQLYRGTLVYGDLVVENYCEPLIDSTTWDAVQERQGFYTGRKHLNSTSPSHPRRANSRYLLSGLAYCARCASPLSGHTSPQKNGLPPAEAYICARSIRNPGQCQRNRIPRQFFESQITDLLLEHILQADTMQAAFFLGQQLEGTRLLDLQAQRAELVKRLAHARRQLGNVANAIAESGHSKTLLDSITHFEARETELLNDLADLDGEIKNTVSELPPAELARRLQLIRTRLDTLDDHQKRALYRGLIHQIDVQRDGQTLRGEITYYYPPPDLDSYPPDGYNENNLSGPDPPETPKTKTVPTLPHPPEAPRYTHSLGLLLRIPYPKRKRA